MAKLSELPELVEPTGEEPVVVLDGGITKRVAIRPLAAAAVAPQVERAEAAAQLSADEAAYSRAALGGIGAKSEPRTASYGVALPVAQDSTGGTGNVRFAQAHAAQRAGFPDRVKIQMRSAGDLQIAVMRPGTTAGSYAPVVLQTVTLLAGVNLLQPLFAMKIGDVLAVRQVTNGGGVEMTPGAGLTASRALAIGTEFTPNASPSVPAVTVEFDYEEVTDTVPARLTALRAELRAQLPSVVGIRDLGAATAWADGTVIDAPGQTPVLRAPPFVLPSNGTPADNQRFADQLTIAPTPNSEVPVFLNSSANWGAPPQQVGAIGVRLPTGAWTGGNQVEVACLAFIDGTTDLSKSSIVWNTGTLSADRRRVTFGQARTLVTDSLATSKLVNPCMGYRPQDDTTVLLFSRDARGDVPNLKLYELARRGGQWTKGIGGAAFAVGGTDAGAREIQGVLDPTWTRAYLSPQRIITDADGTMYAPGWSVVGTSYRIWLLKRAIGDAEWTRFWTIAEGQADVPNSNRVQGEQSVEFAEDGTLLVIDRRTVVGGIGARAWWKVSKAGAIVAAGMYVGLADAAIGAGMCRLSGYGDGKPSRLLVVGPRTSSGSGQADVGFGASVSYDDGASWLSPVSFDADRRIFRRSLLGTALAAATFARNFSGNSCAIPTGNGHALLLVERRGPTPNGTFGNYTAIAGRPVNAASGLRLPTREEELL